MNIESFSYRRYIMGTLVYGEDVTTDGPQNVEFRQNIFWLNF